MTMYESQIRAEADKIRRQNLSISEIENSYKRAYGAYRYTVLEGGNLPEKIKTFYIQKEAYRIVKEEMEGYTWKTSEK